MVERQAHNLLVAGPNPVGPTLMFYRSPFKKIDLMIETWEDVYAPCDDTFMLLDYLDGLDPGENILDIGTGSGILAIYCAKRGSEVVAADIDWRALKLAEKNALCNDVSIEFLKSDLFEGIKGRFDTIIFNPPYLPTSCEEPRDVSWDGGENGDMLVRRFLKELPEFLRNRAFMILSSLNPLKEIRKLANENGLEMRKVSERSFFFEKLYVYEIVKKFHT